MASPTGHAPTPTPGAEKVPASAGPSDSGDASVLGNVMGRDITAFGRTVTATANQLIQPFGEVANGAPYTAAMGEVSKQLAKRPGIQERLLSFNHRSPSELVRSKLSTTEIQYRAFTHVPDEMLRNIPDNEHQYSLFQGFQATIPDAEVEQERGRGRHRRKSSGKQKQLEPTNREHDGPPSLAQMAREKAALNRRLEMLAIRKNMSSSEIREIDQKIANLNQMRNIVFERLAALEQEEAGVDHEIVSVENKIEDLEEELELANIGDHHSVHGTEDGTGSDGTPTTDEFMSESIYGKLPQKKTTRKRKGTRRKAMPVLHEHLEPGHHIKEIQTHSDSITALDFDVPFGTMVTASVDDSCKVWDLNSGKCLGILEGHQASIRCLQVEDHIVATGSADASIRIWDLSRAESYKYVPGSSDDEDQSGLNHASMADCHVMTLGSHVDEVTALYFQGDMLVSGSADKTLRQWDLEKGRCIQTLDVLWAAAQSSMDEGKWRAPMGANEGDFIGALQCFDAALACGSADGMVRLWDLRSGQVHRSLVGHTGAITALQFDDVHLVTSSLDRSIRIWDLRTGTIFDAFGYDNPITSMQFDTRRIVSAAGENVVKVYDKTDGRHWDCGDAENIGTAIVDRVRVKDGYLVEGRRDGAVGVWAC